MRQCDCLLLLAGPAPAALLCTTIAGDLCVFPFTYQTVAYTACTTADSENGAAWCAVQLGSDGRTVMEGKWEDCSPSCPGLETWSPSPPRTRPTTNNTITTPGLSYTTSPPAPDSTPPPLASPVALLFLLSPALPTCCLLVLLLYWGRQVTRRWPAAQQLLAPPEVTPVTHPSGNLAGQPPHTRRPLYPLGKIANRGTSGIYFEEYLV